MTNKREDGFVNSFSKSYRFRYVVHASEPQQQQNRHDPTKRALCGRQVIKISTEPFNEDAEGACKRCLKVIEVRLREHPGWNE